MCMQVRSWSEETFVPSVSRVGFSLPAWSQRPELGVVELQNSPVVLGPQHDLKSKEAMQDAMGCVEVYLQTFRGLPVRFRVQHELRQIYRPLPPRFQMALEQALLQHNGDLDEESTWELYGFRYGELNEVADTVVEELNREIDADELSRRLQLALGQEIPRLLPYPAFFVKGQMTELVGQKEWRGAVSSLVQPSAKATVHFAGQDIQLEPGFFSAPTKTVQDDIAIVHHTFPAFSAPSAKEEDSWN